MTRIQKQVLDFISDYVAREVISPSYQEIADFMGFSRPRAHHVVSALAAKNHIVKTGRGERCIEIVGAGLRQIPSAALLAELMRRELNKVATA
jgi:SOS-response transcriptional repressor LexA